MINVLGWTLRAPSVFSRLVLAVGLSAAVMIADHKGHHLDHFRSALVLVLSPLQKLAGVPSALTSSIGDFFTGNDALRADNARLGEEKLQLQARLQLLESLEAENDRLRAMLGSAARVAERALAADLVEFSTEPRSFRITVARGERDGVYVGQPVIDAHGIMGQVTKVFGTHSQVTLLTDPGHAIPVLVNRNGLKAYVFGVGNAYRVKVRDLTAQADIQPGDLLVSSGMGGTFPPGYPVAVVKTVSDDRNEPFRNIDAEPAARINYGKQVLLIWPGDPQQTGKKP